jgi:hypothetical protein
MSVIESEANRMLASGVKSERLSAHYCLGLRERLTVNRDERLVHGRHSGTGAV